MTIIAATDAGVAWATAASLLLSAVVAGFVAVSHFRTDTRSGDVSEFTAIVNGLKELLSDREAQVDEMGRRLKELTGDVAALQGVVDRANAHVVECERDLRDAIERLRALEGRDGSR